MTTPTGQRLLDMEPQMRPAVAAIEAEAVAAYKAELRQRVQLLAYVDPFTASVDAVERAAVLLAIDEIGKP